MDKRQLRRWSLALVAGSLLVSLLFTAGCSKRVTGSLKENQPPVAYFVNIPPDGSFSSRNPLVYWAGTDPDGRVTDFRYIVVTSAQLGSLTPAQKGAQLGALDQAGWVNIGGVYLHVNDSLPNTQTSATVKMSADLSDPVNSYVSQYVFLQARDDRGAYSNVTYRLLKRNDNPPSTAIQFLNYDESSAPFINSVLSGGAISGIRFRLEGTDELDYPVDPPPFEFQWKIFGPYTYDTVTGLEYNQVLSMILDTVFVTTSAKLHHFGRGEYEVFYCDSLDTAGGNDSVIKVPCETLFIDTIQRDNQYGRIQAILDVDDSLWQQSSLYRPVDSSLGWSTAAYDTVFDAFHNYPSDSTIQRRFIMWARCRDDAQVADLTPAFGPCAVIEPKYERDVLILDFYQVSANSNYNGPIYGGGSGYHVRDTAYNYWKKALSDPTTGWRPGMVFDTTDYYFMNKHGDRISLASLLQHKVVILFSDDAYSSTYYGATGGPTDASLKILKAVDAGVNVWFTMRAGFGGVLATAPRFYRPDVQFGNYFGVDSVRFTGWLNFAAMGALSPTALSQRIEDFVGADSLVPGWPSLQVDTAQLHRRYKWTGGLFNRGRWIDSLGSQPEVGWVFRRNYTQPLYLYKSRYGALHPLGVQYSYEGTPVAHRFGTSLYRTAFFSFTPLGIKDVQGQAVVDSVMNFLFDKYLTAPASVDRYPDAAVKLTVDQIRQNDAIRTEAYLKSVNKKSFRVSSGGK
ncbi:MAG: hypothetical protein WAU88_11080 [Candidatus Zixiibacteriota bacterium]